MKSRQKLYLSELRINECRNIWRKTVDSKNEMIQQDLVPPCNLLYTPCRRQGKMRLNTLSPPNSIYRVNCCAKPFALLKNLAGNQLVEKSLFLDGTNSWGQPRIWKNRRKCFRSQPSDTKKTKLYDNTIHIIMRLLLCENIWDTWPQADMLLFWMEISIKSRGAEQDWAKSI